MYVPATSPGADGSAGSSPPQAKAKTNARARVRVQRRFLKAYLPVEPRVWLGLPRRPAY